MSLLKRQWRTQDGVQQVQCCSCQTFKPADKRNFYFQGKGGCRGPHSWCKPCYATNSGRGRGMRVRVDETASVPPSIERAQAAFVSLHAGAGAQWIGAVA